ncbi:MAG: thermonuclease family protein [Lentisphaerae bacterium]|nr:thermonuclease family protein [Lentisphaerota bacterium]
MRLFDWPRYVREVVVEWRRRGRYRRIIGTVYCESQNVNHELVKEGYAWFDPRYSSNPHLALAHNVARKQQLGLWSSSAPTAPWHHRVRVVGE